MMLTGFVSLLFVLLFFFAFLLIRFHLQRKMLQSLEKKQFLRNGKLFKNWVREVVDVPSYEGTGRARELDIPAFIRQGRNISTRIDSMHKKINDKCDAIEYRDKLTSECLSELKSLIGIDCELAEKVLKIAKKIKEAKRTNI